MNKNLELFYGKARKIDGLDYLKIYSHEDISSIFTKVEGGYVDMLSRDKDFYLDAPDSENRSYMLEVNKISYGVKSLFLLKLLRMLCYRTKEEVERKSERLDISNAPSSRQTVNEFSKVLAAASSTKK